MRVVVNYPAGFDKKGLLTCKYDDPFFRKYWATNGPEKAACWPSFASEGNKDVAEQYLDHQKFVRDGGISEDDFIRFQKDAQSLFRNIEKKIKKGMFIAMIQRSSIKHGINKFIPAGSPPDQQATQDIGDNIDNLIQSLRTPLVNLLDSDISDDTLTKAESLLVQLNIITDIVYGCVSGGGGDTEGWKQRVLINDVNLNPNYRMGSVAVGSGSAFSTSLSNAYEKARKKFLGDLKDCGFILTRQEPKGQHWVVHEGSCYVQLNSSGVTAKKKTAVETLIPLGLTARESTTMTEVAAKMIKCANNLLKNNKNSGDAGVNVDEVSRDLDRVLLKLHSPSLGKLLYY